MLGRRGDFGTDWAHGTWTARTLPTRIAGDGPSMLLGYDRLQTIAFRIKSHGSETAADQGRRAARQDPGVVCGQRRSSEDSTGPFSAPVPPVGGVGEVVNIRRTRFGPLGPRLVCVCVCAMQSMNQSPSCPKSGTRARDSVPLGGCDGEPSSAACRQRTTSSGHQRN
jgi:hypothetical protein